MIRQVFTWVFSVVLRVFFRRIELAGIERVPKDGPVIFVLNHPNALIDPAFMLCLSPRPVSFLGKSTLWSIPVVGTITRAFDSIPVYRKQDGGGDNSKTFRLCRELLTRGGSLALFPEGISHNAPHLQPMKTGAARIGLGAQLDRLLIVPAGLYYNAKGIFRSDALVYFGEPIEAARVEMAQDGEPPRDAVRALTDQIGAALAEVTLQAERAEALGMVERVEKILAATDGDDEEPTLFESFEVQQRLIEGYYALKARDPAPVEALERRVTRYERDLERLGLDSDHLSPEQFTWWGSIRYALSSFLALALMLPVAVVGAVVHGPAYQATRILALRLYKGDNDMLGTLKILLALVLYPITWVLVGVGCWWATGLWWAGVVGALVAPLSAWVALRFLEYFGEVMGAARGLALFLTRRRLFERLHDERVAIRAQTVALSQQFEAQGTAP